MQKLLLIQANNCRQGAPSLGLAYLASFLREKIRNIEINILEQIPRDWHQVEKYSPTVIGISALTHQFSDVVDFTKTLKTHMDIPIILGSSHISACPSLLPESCDIGVISEGEETLHEIFSREAYTAKKLQKIKGVVFRKNGEVTINPLRPLIKNIDTIPTPARDLLDMEHYLKRQNVFGPHFGHGTHIFTSRGCPYKCVFCFSSQFWRSTIRFNSADYVLSEIKDLLRNYKQIEYIYIYDDLFTLNKLRMQTISRKIREAGIDNKVQFGVLGRADRFDEETCQILKSMNVIHVNFGLESGTQRILDFLKNGKLTLEMSKNAVELCRKYGFTVDASFIIGSPEETAEEMLQTFEFIKSLKLDKFAFSIAVPYPGTKLWEILEKQGKVDGKVDWRSLKTIDRDVLNHKDNQFLSIDKVDKEEFYQIWQMFEDERKKLFDYNWREHNY
jgi:anaerobic magnesium-protoporphyrin IX monomethyl ester cyclase